MNRQLTFLTESRHHMPSPKVALSLQDDGPTCSVPLADPTDNFEAVFHYSVSYTWGGGQKLNATPGCPCSSGGL